MDQFETFVAFLGNYNNRDFDQVQPVYQPTQYTRKHLTSPQNVTKPEVATSNWNTDWVAVERPYAVRKTVETPLAPVLSYNDENDELEVNFYSDCIKRLDHFKAKTCNKTV
jgi:hypothetical protein